MATQGKGQGRLRRISSRAERCAWWWALPGAAPQGIICFENVMEAAELKGLVHHGCPVVCKPNRQVRASGAAAGQAVGRCQPALQCMYVVCVWKKRAAAAAPTAELHLHLLSQAFDIALQLAGGADASAAVFFDDSTRNVTSAEKLGLYRQGTNKAAQHALSWRSA